MVARGSTGYRRLQIVFDRKVESTAMAGLDGAVILAGAEGVPESIHSVALSFRCCGSRMEEMCSPEIGGLQVPRATLEKT